MKLRKKTALIISVILAGVIAILYSVSHGILINDYKSLERQNVLRNIERALRALASEIDKINSTAGDYASWDDTYAFIIDGNQEYLNSNLVDSTFIENNLNLILFVDSSGRIIEGKGFDSIKGKQTPLPTGIKDHLLSKGNVLICSSERDFTKGIIMLPEGPMLISSRPILTSESSGPVRGTLLMGRYLDSQFTEYIADNTNLDLSIIGIEHPDALAMMTKLSSNQMVCEPLNEGFIAGYTLLRDIYDKPVLILKAEIPREIYRQGKASIGYLLFCLLLVGLIFGLLSQFLLERIIVSRMVRLSNKVSRISLTRDLSIRVGETGNDEIALLAKKIDNMLGIIEDSQHNLKASEERYRQLFDNALTGNFIAGPDGAIKLCNQAFARILGFNYVGDVLKLNLSDIFEKSDYPDFLYQQDHSLEFHECQLLRSDGCIISVVLNIAGIFDLQGNPVEWQGQIFDITKRKQAEEELKYLSLHDSLTGLYNRTFFTRKMHQLDEECINPVGLVICDVDDLKPINDNLGHSAGDTVLKAAAGIFTASFRNTDLIARIGGDEFAILMPGATHEVVERSLQKVRANIYAYNQKNTGFPLSISCGFAVKTKGVMSMDDLFKQADDSMYRGKLKRKKCSPYHPQIH